MGGSLPARFLCADAPSSGAAEGYPSVRRRGDVLFYTMKTTFSCILAVVAVASTLTAADVRTNAGTRKQAQDAGEHPTVSENGTFLGRIFNRTESTTRMSRQRGTYDTTTAENLAEDHNRQALKGDMADGDKVPGR